MQLRRFIVTGTRLLSENSVIPQRKEKSASYLQVILAQHFHHCTNDKSNFELAVMLVQEVTGEEGSF
jgi:hypothetical protein